MESDKIEKLLEKYFQATTTASEEAALRTYFSQEQVAGHLKQYAPIFRYFSEAKKEEFVPNVQLNLETKSSKKAWYGWVSAAAIVALLIGIYFNFDTTTSSHSIVLEDEYTQEEIASAQEALSLLAINFNKGTEQLSYLKEFEKNTNRFLNENDINH